ncbi:hypothetical protein [Vibrio owensii]|uniref:hypothetical protein n=1 Tax=Vibrio owensii TaxID=696485 RepID=UPI0005EEAF89|nr:hypothetical protein [Vibrio owensii]
MEALEFESRFQDTPIGTMCLECGANSVERETRFIDEFTIVEEVTCRFCGYGEDHQFDYDSE